MSLSDTETKIRETMVKCLVNFLANKSKETDLCADVNETLATIITKDPNVDIRLLGIHQVCDLAHNAATDESDEPTQYISSFRPSKPSISVVSKELLLAVGNRVSSKNKTERRDAITGLAQIFHKHFLRKKLKYVQEGGDDCSIEEILQVLRETCGLQQHDDEQKFHRKNNSSETVVDEKFGWIPQKVFECVCFSDNADPDMRNRIFQIVDDVLLGPLRHDKSKAGESEVEKSDFSLTPTSRAVGLAIILHSLKDRENAYKWMCALFTQRSQLQRALGVYLDARSKAKDCKSGPFELER